MSINPSRVFNLNELFLLDSNLYCKYWNLAVFSKFVRYFLAEKNYSRTIKIIFFLKNKKKGSVIFSFFQSSHYFHSHPLIFSARKNLTNLLKTADFQYLQNKLVSN